MQRDEGGELFLEKYGPWALVAGASTGIGAALAHEAAARGLNVVMIARGEEQLLRATSEVAKEHGVEARPLAVNLASPDIGDVIENATGDLDIGLFVYNATVAPAGRFLDVGLDRHLLGVSVNCRTPTALCHLFGRRFVARGKGGIGMVSSNGGISGAVNFSTYNAGKAYEWILAETLWAELREAGVDVATILVGATSTPNYDAFRETLDPALCGRPESDDPLDRARARLMNPNRPEQVAAALYNQMADGPVCWADPEDEFVARRCLALSREESVGLWTELHKTSTRVPERQAL